MATDDTYVRAYYNSLQRMLFETGYPETEDRTSTPRTSLTKEQVVVAFVEPPLQFISTLLEGGRQLPDGFHLMLSQSWVSKVTSKEDRNLSSVLLHKAITFHKDGATYIDVFAEPRRVTYFVNSFNKKLNDSQKINLIEPSLDCPMSCSPEKTKWSNDEVWIRSVMSKVGLAFPEALSFTYTAKTKTVSDDLKIRLVNFEHNIDMKLIREHIGVFLSEKFMTKMEKIIVKPSDPRFCERKCDTHYNVTDVTSIASAVTSLLAEIKEGSSVVVEPFLETFNPLPADEQTVRLWGSDGLQRFTVQVIVCRDFNDIPKATMINCGMSARDSMINSEIISYQTLDTTLLAFNVFDEKKRRDLDNEIRTKSEDILKHIIAYEKSLTATNGQTDLIAIDMTIIMKDDILTPVGIAVNIHDCMSSCQISEFMNDLVQNTSSLRDDKYTLHSLSETQSRGYITNSRSKPDSTEISRVFQGQSMRPWATNMIVRSQRYLMRGKHVLVLGGGTKKKHFVFSEAKKYGIKITLVDSNAEHYASDQVHQFVCFDFEDHTKDFENAHALVNILRNTVGVDVDGCLTFLDSCVPLAAMVAEMIGLKACSSEAALNAKIKNRTYSILRSRTDDNPHWPMACLYSSNTHPITSPADLDSIPQRIQFPAILKLACGVSSMGVSLVNNQYELEKQYAEMSCEFKKHSSYPMIGQGFDKAFIVMDYHTGSEHDVDIVIFEGKLLAAFISDSGPNRRPVFTGTTASMPTSLPVDKQAQIVAAAYQCCIEIGMVNGTYNVELKITPNGPKLIEINARMGGYSLRHWIQRIYGVDIMLYSFMVACGVKPYVPKHPPVEHLIGIMLLPSFHKHLFEIEAEMESITNMLGNKFDIMWTQYDETFDESDGAAKYEEPFGNIAIIAETANEAKSKLLQICKQLGIECDGYDVQNFIN